MLSPHAWPQPASAYPPTTPYYPPPDPYIAVIPPVPGPVSIPLPPPVSIPIVPPPPVPIPAPTIITTPVLAPAPDLPPPAFTEKDALAMLKKNGTFDKLRQQVKDQLQSSVCPLLYFIYTLLCHNICVLCAFLLWKFISRSYGTVYDISIIRVVFDR
jgi:hypothetical protein